MEEIAELLKETRQDAGLELSEVSKDLNIDEIFLQNIEEGKIGSFKDVFLLKNYFFDYAKYLGLDADKIVDEFNEYLFEYTSRIPIKELEKTIELNTKEDNEKKISSPYTTTKVKNNKWLYALFYFLLLILIGLTIFWSINQINS